MINVCPEWVASFERDQGLDPWVEGWHEAKLPPTTAWCLQQPLKPVMAGDPPSAIPSEAWPGYEWLSTTSADAASMNATQRIQKVMNARRRLFSAENEVNRTIFEVSCEDQSKIVLGPPQRCSEQCSNAGAAICPALALREWDQSIYAVPSDGAETRKLCDELLSFNHEYYENFRSYKKHWMEGVSLPQQVSWTYYDAYREECEEEQRSVKRSLSPHRTETDEQRSKRSRSGSPDKDHGSDSDASLSL